MKENIRIFFTKYKKIIRFLLVVFVVYLAIFQIPFFFTPLRFPPDEITVYHEGKSAAYSKKDGEFWKLYIDLRESGKGTLSKFVGDRFVMDSHKMFRFYRDEYYEYGTAVKVVYHHTQKGWLPPSYHDPYNEIVFFLNYPEDAPQQSEMFFDKESFPVNNCDYASNPEQNPNGYRSMIKHEYPEKAWKYIQTLSLE